MKHSEDCEYLGGVVVVCHCKFTHGQCPACNLFTLNAYEDGTSECMNYTCVFYHKRLVRETANVE